MHPLLLLAASLVGQYPACHPTNCVRQPSYAQPQAYGYAQPQAYGYGYGYGYGYANFGQNYVYNQEQQVLVDPAYSAAATAAYIRQKAAETARAQSDREIAKRLDRIEAKVTAPAPGAGEPPAAPPPDGDGPPELLRKPAPRKPSGLTAIFERNQCAKCHTGEAASKEFRMFDDDGRPVVLDIKAKQKIYARTDPRKAKSMPPKGDRVSADDRKSIAESILADVAAARQAADAVEESIKE